ncbi:MAG: hypothetical protein IPH13_08795 [Planctomycetes bacterium]|nr:hypothetical protein [Planctomycetota bacterium]MCC7169239.1 hypothetical protein [Planctomycetota bacterium]
MSDESLNPTRRALLLAAGAAGLVPLDAAEDDKGAATGDPELERDREFVLGAGMTPAEADCWAAAAKCAGFFFDLPELHPMDRQEVASAIHVVQNKLLSRVTYRKYLELAKAATK